MARYFLRGDSHGDFKWLPRFTEYEETTTEDVLIILGDSGINYFLDKYEAKKKKKISQLPITLFVIRGNHDYNPLKLKNIKSIYSNRFKGIVYYEPEYPNIIYSAPFGIYYFENKRTLIIGGAYSVDKEYRFMMGWQWFEDEQLSEEEKQAFMRMLAKEPNKNFDYVLTHTCPFHMMPIELFLPNLDQSKIDKSTEKWLEQVYFKINYNKWYFGHYHGNSNRNEKDILLFDRIILLGDCIED